MGETLVRLEGAQEVIVDKLTELGIFKNRSEVIRAGILKLAEQFHLFESIKDLEDELAARKMMKLSEEINAGKRKLFTEEQTRKKYGFK